MPGSQPHLFCNSFTTYTPTLITSLAATSCSLSPISSPPNFELSPICQDLPSSLSNSAKPSPSPLEASLSPKSSLPPVAFKPRKGSALLFYSTNVDGTHDPVSMHAGCPVIKGAKWTATIWIHSRPFRPKTFKAPEGTETNFDPGLCQDSSVSKSQCSDWRKTGECQKNPTFMNETCGATCGACSPCSSKADPCYRANREARGYLNTEVEDGL